MGQRCCPSKYASDSEGTKQPLAKDLRGSASNNSFGNSSAFPGPSIAAGTPRTAQHKREKSQGGSPHKSPNKAGDTSKGEKVTMTGSAGRRLLEYQKLAFLARGSFAEVTLALHRPTGRYVAIKKIAKQLVEERGRVASTQAERLLLGNIHHPLIVSLCAAFQSKKNLYLVLSFAAGGDFRMLLSHWKPELQSPDGCHRYCGCEHSTVAAAAQGSPSFVEGSHPPAIQVSPPAAAKTSASYRPCASSLPSTEDGLPLPHILFYGTELILALRHLHRLGVIYRDVKPENMLLNADGHLQLADLGVAKISNPLKGTEGRPADRPSITERADSFTGTVEYVSPESLCGENCTAASDYWGVGCVLFELANGRPAFRGRTESDLYCAIVTRDVAMDGSPKNFVLSDTSNDAGNIAMSKLYDLVSRLLHRTPEMRLGGVDGDADAILRHPFFSDVYLLGFFPELAVRVEALQGPAGATDAEPPSRPISATLLPEIWSLFETKQVASPIQLQLRGPDDASYFWSPGNMAGKSFQLSTSALMDDYYFANDEVEQSPSDLGVSPNIPNASQSYVLDIELQLRDPSSLGGAAEGESEQLFIERRHGRPNHNHVSSYEADESESKYNPEYQGMYYTNYSLVPAQWAHAQ